MTPLAQQVANQLTLPLAQRCMDDQAGVLALIDQDLHCFEVSAIAHHVMLAMDDSNLWPDVESILPRAFLPSPATWIEFNAPEIGRSAWVLQEIGEGSFRLSYVSGRGGLVSLPMCDFSAGHALHVDGRVDIKYLLEDQIEQAELAKKPKPWEVRKEPANMTAQIVTNWHQSPSEQLSALEVKKELLKLKRAAAVTEYESLDGMVKTLEKLRDPRIVGGVKHGIAFSMLALDLINTPGLVGLRQRDPHRGLARRLLAARAGSYPLQGWSEVVLKHQTRIAGETEHLSGATYHKCLHFVRSHIRHFQDGRTTIIPAHWRGDPALGIKRTRYMVAA